MSDALTDYIQSIEKSLEAKYAGTGYLDSYIAFLDIMGMKNLVQTPYQNLRQIFNVIELGKRLYGGIYVGNEQWHDFFHTTIMSDSIVLSVDASREHAFSQLIGFSSYIIKQLIQKPEKPVFLRGGITRGFIYQNDDQVFGLGLVKAYELENVIAKSMRCIISKELTESDQQVTKYLATQTALVLDPCDDYYFIDFIDDENRGKLKYEADSWIDSESTCESIKEKYRWLKREVGRR